MFAGAMSEGTFSDVGAQFYLVKVGVVCVCVCVCGGGGGGGGAGFLISLFS